MPKLKSTSFRVKSPLIAKGQLGIAQSNSVKKPNHQPSIIYYVYIYTYIYMSYIMLYHYMFDAKER